MTADQMPGYQPEPVGATPPGGPAPTTPSSGGKGKVWMWVAIVVVALAVLGTGAYLLMQGGKVTVPDTVGRSQSEAKGLIEGAGLAVGTVTEAKDATAAPGTVVSQTPAAGAKADKGAKVDLVVVPSVKLIKVPDVVGKTKAEAQKAIDEAGLTSRVVSEVNTAPAGQVFGQLPEGGSEASTGTVVAIGVSTGPAAQTATVPNVVGKTQSEADKLIREATFVPVSFKDYSDSVPAGNVIGQLPEAGTKAVAGHEIAITVSLGKTPAAQVSVPDVGGKTQSEAESAIKNAGLVPAVAKGYSDTVPSGSVAGQSPGAGTKLPKGGEVAIMVSQGQAPVGGTAVPNVTGKTESEAKSVLEGATLTAVVVKDYSDTVAAGIVIGQLPKAGAEVLKNSEVTILVSLGKGGATSVKVPNVTGKSQSAAESALKSAGLVALSLKEPSDSVSAGNVARQLPVADKTVTPGSQVAILVSTGKPDDAVEVPDVKGATKDEAEAKLREAGFEPLVVEDYRADTDKGKVFGQMPEAGSKLPKGSTVAIGVSKGAPQ